MFATAIEGSNVIVQEWDRAIQGHDATLLMNESLNNSPLSWFIVLMSAMMGSTRAGSQRATFWNKMDPARQWHVKFAQPRVTPTVDIEVTPETGTLIATVKITKVARSAGMIIQNYDLEVRTKAGGRLVYRGDTYFGFFSKSALATSIRVRAASALARREPAACNSAVAASWA